MTWKYMVRCGTPGSIGAYPATSFVAKDPKYPVKGAVKEPGLAAQKHAIKWLRKSQTHLTKFDQAGLDRLGKLIEDLNSVALGDWINSSDEAPMIWTLDAGWTTLCVELWREWSE
jgi:hypothetical protein